MLESRLQYWNLYSVSQRPLLGPLMDPMGTGSWFPIDVGPKISSVQLTLKVLRLVTVAPS